MYEVYPTELQHAADARQSTSCAAGGEHKLEGWGGAGDGAPMAEISLLELDGKGAGDEGVVPVISVREWRDIHPGLGIGL